MRKKEGDIDIYLPSSNLVNWAFQLFFKPFQIFILYGIQLTAIDEVVQAQFQPMVFFS